MLFSRSVEKLNLVYKIYIEDSDSKGYAIVYKAMPYEVNVFIEKEECISHIIKRIASGLREILLGKKVCFALVSNFSCNALSNKEPY